MLNQSKTKPGGHHTIASHSTNASHALRTKNDNPSRRMNSLDVADSNHGYDFSRASLPFNFASANQDGKANSSTHSIPPSIEEYDSTAAGRTGNIRSF